MSYLDDVLVYSMDTWDHLKHLRSIVEAHAKAGIKIQPKKTKIFQTETEYLGHKVSQRRSTIVRSVREGYTELATPHSLQGNVVIPGVYGIL